MIIVTRKQLNEKYAISKSQWDRRHDDLLEHLQDFMGIREIKSEKVLTLMRQKVRCQTQFRHCCKSLKWSRRKKIMNSTLLLREVLNLNSIVKAKLLEMLLQILAKRDTVTTLKRLLLEDNIKEPFGKYGESDGQRYWCDYNTYEVLSQEILDAWRSILSEERIGEQER